jgi:hypothetical protein
MRVARSFVAGFALLAALLTMAPGRAKAQAVGFIPGVGQVSDGVYLNVTPVVSADRRYVRLSLAPQFQSVEGFSTFPVPAAIAGGGNGGGGGGLGGLGGLGGAGGGLRSIPAGPADFAAWYPGLGVPYAGDYVTRLPEKPLQARTGRSRKPLPDPEIVPIKKPESKANAAPRR